MAGVDGKPRKKRPSELLPAAAYDSMLSKQNGVCAICGRPPKTRRLDIDHDHKTGAIRGLLCVRCNRALPSWVTVAWLDKAADYLHRTDPEYVATLVLSQGQSRIEVPPL